jgi:transcriptional regulator with XRE-family HTH domain
VHLLVYFFNPFIFQFKFQTFLRCVENCLSGKVEPTLSSLEKIAEALDIKIAELFGEDQPTDINSYDKSEVEKLRLLNQLEETEKKSIFTIIDMAITKKRLKDTLSNALNSAM